MGQKFNTQANDAGLPPVTLDSSVEGAIELAEAQIKRMAIARLDVLESIPAEEWARWDDQAAKALATNPDELGDDDAFLPDIKVA